MTVEIEMKMNRARASHLFKNKTKWRMYVQNVHGVERVQSRDEKPTKTKNKFIFDHGWMTLAVDRQLDLIAIL